MGYMAKQAKLTVLLGDRCWNRDLVVPDFHNYGLDQLLQLHHISLLLWVEVVEFNGSFIGIWFDSQWSLCLTESYWTFIGHLIAITFHALEID